ncbi:uncharacterized protein E0L32_004869 [Thyridium curvatum]|uniref:Uncharacterized protein n=1 Tax=Thyridium curvatum TaxID=1093900 RepID=A0A507BCA8_9PEZI|nr:uncharacterized protein E0L32_004869 [Thyridium curvatum]TPX15039.1 hypothetical protein E0L32_004869 [Thyridium curvatum]
MTPAPDNPLERKRDRFKRLFLGDRADQANAQASTCQSDVLIEKGDHSAPSAIQQATEPTAVKGNVSKSPEDPSKDDNVSQVAEVEAGQVLSPTALRFQESFGSDDIWSAAYREAILTFDSSQRSLLLAGSRETFFQLMENLQGDVGGGSTLSRGLLHMKGPLERLNMALDVAKPLTSLEPTQALSTAVGIVQTVIKAS